MGQNESTEINPYYSKNQPRKDNPRAVPTNQRTQQRRDGGGEPSSATIPRFQNNGGGIPPPTPSEDTFGDGKSTL